MMCKRTKSTYWPILNFRETQKAIQEVKNYFSHALSQNLNLTEVTAPLLMRTNTGLNDTLADDQAPVTFAVPALNHCSLEVVQSLAKWKRLALYKYGFLPGEGLYAHMLAIRKEETLDPTHSVHVDQWDWEMVIRERERHYTTLTHTVEAIYEALRDTEAHLYSLYPSLQPVLPESISFISTHELEKRYPHLSPKERETIITREKGAVFLSEIGGPLASGKPHERRAPDYDDWALNGDILLWYPQLDKALELSSMGIRVNRHSMLEQITASGCRERLSLPYHQKVLSGELPSSLGGGIGQSRLAMMFLKKSHIGEVQPSIWPEAMEMEFPLL